MLGHSIVSQHFMEPEGSIPNSPVPILSQTNPVNITPSHLPIVLLKQMSYILDFHTKYLTRNLEKCFVRVF
jgi:hypothetical protein